MKNYLIKERGHPYLYHWIVLMLGGLRHIRNNDYPINICFENLHNQGYHIESLDIIKDKYKLVKVSTNLIENYGEEMIKDDEVSKDVYIFLRDLFLNRIENVEKHDHKRIYISRKKSGITNPFNNGISKREILNETVFYDFLMEKNFSIISLEEYNFSEKINLFRNAEIIISPNSSALTFCIFCNKNTKIIEINTDIVPNANHYKNICESLNINYNKFTKVKTTDQYPYHINSGYNMIIDEKEFKDFINIICK